MELFEFIDRFIGLEERVEFVCDFDMTVMFIELAKQFIIFFQLIQEGFDTV
jgi:hypothetical protein